MFVVMMRGRVSVLVGNELEPLFGRPSGAFRSAVGSVGLRGEMLRLENLTQRVIRV